MKLSKTSLITRFTRWILTQKWILRIYPTMLRYGGWFSMMIFYLFGTRLLLLTTIGRKSGKPRTTPAMYVNRNQDYFISPIPSGNQRYPNWYYNLMANPKVTVEIFWKRRAYLAEPVKHDEEKLALVSQYSFGLIEAVQDHPPEDIPVIQLKPTSL